MHYQGQLMTILLKAEPREAILARAVCIAREIVDTLGVGRRNVLLTLQRTLRAIVRDTPLSTLLIEDILHAQYEPLVEKLRKISEAL
jgi:hypothetical protein